MSPSKKSSKRKRQFEVPKDFVKTFLDHVDDTGLEYTLSEVDEDENLIIHVSYSTDEKEEIMNLIELLDEYFEETEDEETEEDEDN